MSSTTEKCREILLRLTKAIENIEVYSYKKRDDSSLKKTSTPSTTQDRKEQKPAHINANSSVLSSSAYNLLFQTLLELRTKSYTKNQAIRAKLIQYNIIKKIFHLLCEKPAGLQTAYENYLKSNGRKKGEERQGDGRQNDGDKEGTVKEESKNEVESLGRGNPKNNDSVECCLQPFELDEQEMVPFADFRDLLLSLLGNFCLDSAARSQVIKHRGITILRTILFEAESESIWRRCCRTLANLAVDPACRKAIQATDITAKIICILESSCDSECKSTICRTLRLFAESGQLLKTIIDCNGITILIQICRYGTHSVKGAAVKTLAELGKKNCSVEFGQQVLRGEGLVKLVEMTKEDAVYSEHALCILIYLSHHSFIRPLMGSSDVIQTLQSKFESEIPAHLYSEILNAFCLFSNEAVNRVKLRQFGILKILLSALQDQRYALLHNRIISAFVNFLYDDSSFDLLLENGLVPVLFVHLQRCAGFSFTVPNTEPFVEALIEAVMNRNDESGNSNTHGPTCSNTQEKCMKHATTGSSSTGKESSPEEKCTKHATAGSSSTGKESSLEEKCTTHTTTGSSSIGKESILEGNPESKLVNKGQSTDSERILSNSPLLVSNNNAEASKHDPKVEEKLSSSPTHKQCLSASDNPPDEDQETLSARKAKNCQTAQAQRTCLPDSACVSGQLQVPGTRGRIPKRKHETEVFSEPSKRYRLSLGVEADPQKEPAILSFKIPDTHNLSPLVAETVADMVDMSPSTVLSHVGKCSEHLEPLATEIIAFHGSSLLEPSQSQTMDMESNHADIFVSLRSKCSVGRIEEILKMKGFCIRTESETRDSDQEVDSDEADEDEHEDDKALEKQERNFYCIDSPSYQNKITWQPEDYATDAAVKSSSLTKEITGISCQYLSPLSNASYHSPDWSPNFSSQEKDFSSKDSYSSEEEMQVDVGDRTPSHSDNYTADNDCQESVCKTSRHKKNTSLGATKKCSKTQSSVNLVNRKTEDNILILLSRISQKENPTKYLANVESFLCLLRYIGHVPLAFPRSVRILGRVVSNLFCLESLLGFMAPALIFLELMTSWNHRICDTRCHSDMFWTPSRATWLNIGSAFSQNSCIEGSDDLLKAGQLILNEFGVVAEINFGTCLLAQHLMKETPQQNYVIACLPFLCRSHNVQEKLLVRLRGFDLLQNIVMSNPKSCLSKVVILGLSYLACHLNVKPDPIMPTPYPKCSKMKKSIKCCLKTFPKDITFVTDYGQKVFANKEQLTQQSDVFSAMLTSNFLESKSAEIAIPDISLVALRFIVHYLHGCSVKCSIIDYIVSPKSSLPFDGIVNVLAHADQYMLTKLQDFLVKIVREKYLNYQTAGKFYNVASLHNYNDLRKECLTYCLVSLVFGSKSVSCMMDILTGPYAREFLDLVKKTLKKHATIDPFAKI